MNDWDLRIFDAVARSGAIGRAAAKLNTVQSNVTTRIRQLEQELGVSLFDRHSRGVVLTAAGMRLQPYALGVLELMEDARKAARDDGAPKGPLSLGTLETTAALRLPPMLTAFAQAYPEVDLSLATGTTAGLIDDVLARRLEGAFVVGPVDRPDLIAEPVFVESLVLLTAPAVTDLDALRGSKDLKIVVFRLGCSYRQRLEMILAKRGLVGLRVLEFGSLEAIIGCVAAGIGVTLLPKGTFEPALRARLVAQQPLSRADASVETVFVRRADAYASSAMTAFVNMARSPPPRAVAAE